MQPHSLCYVGGVVSKYICCTPTSSPWFEFCAVGAMCSYLSAGFFVVYFSTGFVELADSMKLPELWAGLGRTANNFCAVIIGHVSVAMLASGNSMMISVTALVLFALISITMFLYAGRVKTDLGLEKEEDQDAVKTDENDIRKFTAFAERFSLTERETS